MQLDTDILRNNCALFVKYRDAISASVDYIRCELQKRGIATKAMCSSVELELREYILSGMKPETQSIYATAVQLKNVHCKTDAEKKIMIQKNNIDKQITRYYVLLLDECFGRTLAIEPAPLNFDVDEEFAKLGEPLQSAVISVPKKRKADTKTEKTVKVDILIKRQTQTFKITANIPDKVMYVFKYAMHLIKQKTDEYDLLTLGYYTENPVTGHKHLFGGILNEEYDRTARTYTPIIDVSSLNFNSEEIVEDGVWHHSSGNDIFQVFSPNSKYVPEILEFENYEEYIKSLNHFVSMWLHPCGDGELTYEIRPDAEYFYKNVVSGYRFDYQDDNAMRLWLCSSYEPHSMVDPWGWNAGRLLVEEMVQRFEELDIDYK